MRPAGREFRPLERLWNCFDSDAALTTRLSFCFTSGNLRAYITLEMLGFEARGNLEYPEKNSWSERNPTTNSNYTYNTGSMPGLIHPGHSGGSRGISGDRLLHGRIGIRVLWDECRTTRWKSDNWVTETVFVWLQCKLEFRGVLKLGCSFCF